MRAMAYARFIAFFDTTFFRVLLTVLVVGSGFEPLKAKPADLQSAPIGHSGNPPFST